jgi:hypothetical protein
MIIRFLTEELKNKKTELMKISSNSNNLNHYTQSLDSKIENIVILNEETTIKENSRDYYANNESSFLKITKVCRLCYHEEIPNRKLISPCFCQGNNKFVHEECLLLTIEIDKKDNKLEKGNICNKCNFQYEIKKRRECSKSNLTEICKKILILAFIIFILVVVYLLSILYVISSIRRYTIWCEGFVLSIITLLFLFVIFLLIKETASEIRKIYESWKIYEINSSTI